MNRLLPRLILFILLLAAALWGALYQSTWRPADREAVEPLCSTTDRPALLKPGQAVKVMTWNVQYLAGKRYVFWYERLDGSGPDERPSAEDLAFNLDEVVRVIRDEQPDLVLLQELGDGARDTGYQNQLALLQERLADLYPCSTQAFNWKAEFVPHPRIWGSVGLKLATLSRYRIDSAERLQLPLHPSTPLVRLFQPRPALLVSYLPLQGGGRLALINTQQYTPEPDPETLRQQTAATAALLDRLERSGTPWLIGGDFSLLPLGQYPRLDEQQRVGYLPDSPLHLLWDKYPMIPSNAEAGGIERSLWLTYWPNDPQISGPDRTLDYLIHSPSLRRLEAGVRQGDTLQISDHLPLLARLQLPAHP
ncbi:endonuclease/exonuclease/phosphatase family protein [Pseudomonas sp. DTU_2021_1001937_2_SI_NGA_ILE_001]|uniref:endonuclease/exonuclease/phosphatase family protein n=1 Tax=Pseudomonas sp. DTU_2021_1001937_2_SI_NGA_ILE_001 TaxID=3077589 RepID=UPI0028FC261E|nr:endonuclease/exonuclease/phosphatase family protein [Pseudomonas sp. DTU_2021_1001937_2_SI_NGA_ILE_001]WNW13354.1 endonuclease/exonuclease/phosphatase family protein [Pseudomonas sp. DTU_2021_1001937_2_SI_NGA_ILE_001]